MARTSVRSRKSSAPACTTTPTPVPTEPIRLPNAQPNGCEGDAEDDRACFECDDEPEHARE